MTKLQKALKERARVLKEARATGCRQANGVDLSDKAITRTLQGAGILDKNGDVIHRFTAR